MKYDRKMRGNLALFGLLGKLMLSKMGLTDFANKKELQGTPKVGKWYAITPAEAKTAEGKPWHGLIKLGKENKVLVYFLGGGVSTDAYTAARPHKVKDGYYNDQCRDLDFVANIGIANNHRKNPFRDWTVLILQYSTGDFHCGDGEFPYQTLDGKNAVLYHYGYRNYTAFMKEAMQYISKPDDLLITGFSAGGFGASLLADDIVKNYFPDQKHFTVLIDSSVIYYDGWRDAAENVWHSPKDIYEKLKSNNLTLDGLKALSATYRGRARILFDCSTRDGALSNHQSYFRKGEKTWEEDDGDYFETVLKEMAAELQKLPDTGLYIWDGLSFGGEHPTFTRHTIIDTNDFYQQTFGQISVADWLMRAVNGNITSFGLDLLK